MKKRLLLTGLLIILVIITLLLLKYVINRVLRMPVLYEEFAAIVPSSPLAYVQCSHLRTRLEHIKNSPDYLTFIQSEFVKQIQQMEWWSDFSYSFEQLWHSLIIDPMRIVGTDVAIAVYNAGENEIIPGIVLISKVDQIAKIAERVLYVFDKLGGQNGITFEQDYQRFPIYAIEQPDMICPLYYTIIDDIGVMSTSLPLLKNTILLALSGVEASVVGMDEPPMKASPFRKTIYDIPDKRFVTGYLDLSLFFKELRENPLFHLRESFQGNIWEETRNFPLMTIHLNTYADNIILRTDLFFESDISGSPGDTLEDEETYRFVQESLLVNFPIVAAFYRNNFTSFLQNWQELFPQWEWSLPIQLPIQPWDTFGDLIECRVSDVVIGTLYAIPDISCMLDTQHPELSMVFLNTTINNILDQILPSVTQRALVKISDEPYRNTNISRIQFMFQEILSYAITKSGNKASQSFYTILATNGKGLKAQIDSLQAHPNRQPYLFTPQQDDVAFEMLLKNDALSEFIQIISRTNTFSLLYPWHTHRQFYQVLPFVIQFLKPLPPVLIEGGVKGAGIYLELRVRKKTKFME